MNNNKKMIALSPAIHYQSFTVLRESNLKQLQFNDQKCQSQT